MKHQFFIIIYHCNTNGYCFSAIIHYLIKFDTYGHEVFQMFTKLLIRYFIIEILFLKGLRLERKIDPMQRVIDYMRERELRPTELFRSFDKAVGNKLTHQEFIERIKARTHYML